jgi:hypothetical protein
MAALRFRFAPPAASHGAGSNLALTINTDHSVGAGQAWVVISSVVFGFVHLLNPMATLTGAIFISIEAGLLLAAAYMLTRRLWLGIGFHISWNYFQSAVFGGVVSGGVAEPGLLKTVITGPDLITGGSFGLEASLIPCLLATSTGVFLAVRAVQAGHVVLPFWSQKSVPLPQVA